MSRQEIQEAYSSRVPVFDGTKYDFWKVRMEAYVMPLGVDVWTLVLVDYNVPNIPPTDADGNFLDLRNGKAKHVILVGLS